MTNHNGPKNTWKKFTIFSNEGNRNKNYIETVSDYCQEKKKQPTVHRWERDFCMLLEEAKYKLVQS